MMTMAMRLMQEQTVGLTRVAAEVAGLTATGAASWIAANGGDYVTSTLILGAAGSIFLAQRMLIAKLMRRIGELEGRVDHLTELLIVRGHPPD